MCGETGPRPGSYNTGVTGMLTLAMETEVSATPEVNLEKPVYQPVTNESMITMEMALPVSLIPVWDLKYVSSQFEIFFELIYESFYGKDDTIIDAKLLVI